MGEDPGEKIYTQDQMMKAINDCRITERYNAWVVMANMGIPADRIPQVFKDARDIVTNIVNTPPKKTTAAPESGP